MFNQHVSKILSGPLVEMRKTKKEKENIAIEAEKLQKAMAMILPSHNAA